MQVKCRMKLSYPNASAARSATIGSSAASENPFATRGSEPFSGSCPGRRRSCRPGPPPARAPSIASRTSSAGTPCRSRSSPISRSPAPRAASCAARCTAKRRSSTRPARCAASTVSRRTAAACPARRAAARATPPCGRAPAAPAARRLRASSRRSSRPSARAVGRSSVPTDREPGAVDRLERHDAPRRAVELDGDPARPAGTERSDDRDSHRRAPCSRDRRLPAIVAIASLDATTPRRPPPSSTATSSSIGVTSISRGALGLRQQPGRDDLLGRRLGLDPGQDLLHEVGVLDRGSSSRSGAPGRAARRRS